MLLREHKSTEMHPPALKLEDLELGKQTHCIGKVCCVALGHAEHGPLEVHPALLDCVRRGEMPEIGQAGENVPEVHVLGRLAAVVVVRGGRLDLGRGVRVAHLVWRRRVGGRQQLRHDKALDVLLRYAERRLELACITRARNTGLEQICDNIRRL